MRQYFNEGMSVKEIALLFKVSKGYVSRIVMACRKREPVKVRAPRPQRRSTVPDETIRDILTLLDTNKYGEITIARMLNVSPRVVKRVRERQD